MKNRVLIVEDDNDLRELLEEIYTDEGFEVITAANGTKATETILNFDIFLDLIVTDIQLPEVKGSTLLKLTRENRAETAVIIMTAFGSVEQAVEMVKNGAFQYITKPFQTEDLLNTSQKALASTKTIRAATRLRRETSKIPSAIIGTSRKMRDLLDLIARSSQSNSNILITGESGTGKELVAHAIHEASKRKGYFVPVNCSAIPAELVESELFGHTGQAFTGAKAARSGLFESADKGTLFLDEIGELPLPVQPKLLRVLQENTIRRIGNNREISVDVRIIAATNLDLEQAIEEGTFREDLFWRLNVIHLQVPPLRERILDIPLLVEHFLNKYKRDDMALEVSAETVAILATITERNVRELENTIERAVTLARGALSLRMIFRSEYVKTQTIQKFSIKPKKQTYFSRTRAGIYLGNFEENNGNKSKTAEILNLDRKPYTENSKNIIS